MRRTLLVTILLLLLPLVLVLSLLLITTGAPPPCTTLNGNGGAAATVNLAGVPAGPVAGYNHDQLVNAALIMQAAKDLNLSLRDQQIGVMTAMGESDLGADPTSRVPNGDVDTGIFQQRAIVGWYADGSTIEENNTLLQDVTYAAKTFYTGHTVAVAGTSPAGSIGYHIPGLVDVANRDSLDPTIAAHKVQGNANPWHYTKWWDDAVEVTAALSGFTIGVAPAPAGSPAVPAAQPPATTVSAAAAPAAGTVQPTTVAGNPYHLAGGTKPEAVALANTLGPMFGVKEAGGWRPSARDPNGHPSGLAIDFMVPSDSRDMHTPEGEAMGDSLSAYAIANAQALGVKYIIWKQRIWMASKPDIGWRAMSNRGDNNQNHYNHVHINVIAGAQIAGNLPAGSLSGAVAACPALVGGAAGLAPAGGTLPDGTWISPVAAAPNTSSYGWRIHPVSGTRKFHYGTDFGAACDTPIKAPAAGTVITARPAGGFGNLIEIDHGAGVVTRYGHMFNTGVLVKVGDHVGGGQVIGRVGTAGTSTGCHLHLEVRTNGQNVDPYAFLTQHGVTF